MKHMQVVFLEIMQQWDGVFKDKLSFKDLEELLVCQSSFCIFLISVCRHQISQVSWFWLKHLYKKQIGLFGLKWNQLLLNEADV